MKMEHGHVFRRNRRHLRISKEIEEEFPTVVEPVAEPVRHKMPSRVRITAWKGILRCKGRT